MATMLASGTPFFFSGDRRPAVGSGGGGRAPARRSRGTVVLSPDRKLLTFRLTVAEFARHTTTATHMHATARTLTVIYGTIGGMSDVGKFAVQLAKSMGVAVRAIALYDGRTEKAGVGEVADVTDEQLRAQLSADLLASEIKQLDITSDGAQAVLEEAVAGAAAVVASFSSRQPELPRYLELGIRKVIGAMESKRVTRLVCLSSFGIGDDFIPMSPIKLLWLGLLRTAISKPRVDLEKLEAAVQASSLDYVLVRPCGLTPSEPVTGSYQVVSARGQGRLELGIAKADVAKCLLDEALEPKFHRAAITVGKRPAPRGRSLSQGQAPSS